MSVMTGRSDFGRATTAGLIEELHDKLRQAEMLEKAVYDRLTAEERKEYDEHATYIDLYSARIDMSKLRDLWHDRVDAEAAP